MAKRCKTHITTGHNTSHTLELIIEWIVLVGFLPDGNGRSCGLHPFGCGNSLVLNWEDSGVGLYLRLRSFVHHKLACYTMNDDGSDGFHNEPNAK